MLRRSHLFLIALTLLSIHLCRFALALEAPAASDDADNTAESIVGSKIEFNTDVMSILSKTGCNAGTCHGNLNGKGGFKLSLRGQDPQFDYDALVSGSRGRRVNFAAPAQSLFLRKATGKTPHRGGVRLQEGSPEYQELLSWLSSGANGPSNTTPQLEELLVEPRSAVLAANDDSLQIHVTAKFADGQTRNITQRACYELSNLNANVSFEGIVTRAKFGETTLIVRYLDQQVAVPIAFVDPPIDFQWQSPEQHNFVDKHVHAKLEKLSIQPSPLCNDSTFVRRAFLDSIGRLPTAEEARNFVADTDAKKRSKLIDGLLEREEFSDYWAMKFADILRVEEKVLDAKGVDVFHGWIRQQIADHVPHDQFVTSLLTGTGNTFEEPPANFYRANRDPSTRGETAARLFLGTRLQCAKCHNHPFDRWTQDDYYRWSTVFSQLNYDIGKNKRKDKLDLNEFAGEQTVFTEKRDEVRNPTTDKFVKPKFLGGEELKKLRSYQRLPAVAEWVTSPDNTLFVQSQANFFWFHLMGKGLVDPIDDFRLTNPASNPELLEALAEHFVEVKFDIRQYIRSIMLSRTYQAAAQPLESNQHDESSFSRAFVHRLPAEVLLDMQSDVLAVSAAFVGYPAEMRAVQLPGVKRVPARKEAPAAGDRFLKTFGKPERILACDCERSNETNLQQVLGLIGEGLNERLDNSPILKS
ncbi:MAG: DUF1549 domain-containing protein, partial [Planctomycetota bacterium]